jgi:hypothetical protein
MDVMACGLCLYELATAIVYNGKSRTFWENGGVAHGQPINDRSINIALSELTDAKVMSILEKTFHSAQFGNLKSFLIEALRVDSDARSTGERLLSNSSFLGGTDRTVDQKGIMAKVRNSST